MKKTLDKPHSTKPLPAYSEDGVDLALIRWMLCLTVEERLQLLEDHAAFAWELRHANSFDQETSLSGASKTPCGGRG